jgi:hypothetical protein
MTLQTITELVLALGASLLLARDVHRAWTDRLRRPVTLLAAALLAAIIIGAFGGRTYPSPWWLVLPSGVLLWEVARGWRRAPRCHLWEAGVGLFGAGLLLAGTGLVLGHGSIATALSIGAAASAALAAGFLVRSRQREPRPWRAGDPLHYERRLVGRPRV